MKKSAIKNLVKYIYILPLTIPIHAQASLAPIPGVPDKSLEDVLNDAISWLISFGISLCVLLIIWGGINYVASTGDEERIKKSKKIVSYAIWGILIIGLSYAIIRVVNDVLT